MADERVHTGGPQAEPPGEAVHLPGPTYLPVVVAAGITLLVVGVVISVFLVVIGGAIAAIGVWRWIRATRTEIAELPLEH